MKMNKVKDKLPKLNSEVLVKYHAHNDDEPITRFDFCTGFFHVDGFAVKDDVFYTSRKLTVVSWLPLDEFFGEDDE